MRLRTLVCFVLAGLQTASAQEIPAITGWQIGLPTPGTHRACVDIGAPHAGKGCGKITGTASENGARGCFIQEFYKKTAVKPGRAYHYAISYRTAPQTEGYAAFLIDCYTAEGEKSHK